MFTDREKILGGAALALAILLVLVIVQNSIVRVSSPEATTPPDQNKYSGAEKKATFVKSKSDGEFNEYISKSATEGSSQFWGIDTFTTRSFAESNTGISQEKSSLPLSADAVPQDFSRFSQTNVQVAGIDEPDIVKTDGKNIFLSRENSGYYEPIIMEERSSSISPNIMPAPQMQTSLIKAVPPSELGIVGEIPRAGDLLLSDDTLIVIGTQTVSRFDVSDRSNPKITWEYALPTGASPTDARLANGDLFLVVQSVILHSFVDCPMPVLSSKENTKNIDVSCTNIFHPEKPTPAQTTHTIVRITPKTGAVEKTVSLIGGYDLTIAQFPESIYAAYADPVSTAQVLIAFVNSSSDLLPNIVAERIRRLENLDISDAAKEVEVRTILENYFSQLSQDERATKESVWQNSFADFIRKNGRNFEKTRIARIETNTLTITADGSIPGTLLNQFAIDEYDGFVRTATTIGRAGFGLGSSTGSESEITVLSKDLETVGSLSGLGLDERIYSARFVGKTGYLVTFRETDPFYVIDLSDPKNPQKSGELKIPGYSSYLHPLTDTLVVGIGKDGAKVKASLFDVSNPRDPREVSVFTLDDYWSEAVNNHHAFLQDQKHSIFALPGATKMYVFSYQGNTLSLARAIDITSPLRTLFIGDTLYLIGRERIVAVEERNWDRVGEIVLQSNATPPSPRPIPLPME